VSVLAADTGRLLRNVSVGCYPAAIAVDARRDVNPWTLSMLIECMTMERPYRRLIDPSHRHLIRDHHPGVRRVKGISAMGVLEVLSWLVAGLIAGGLVGAVKPDTSTGARLAILSTGVAGALGGGWGAGSLSGMSTVAFLGAVCVGVWGAGLCALLLQRRPPTRYYT
jgi:hypothetical protein